MFASARSKPDDHPADPIGQRRSLDYLRPTLDAAEVAAGETNDIAKVLALFRTMPIDDLGIFLLGMPDPGYPRLSALFPQMAAAAVQTSWTGASGYPLLQQSLTFVRLLSQNFQAITGQPLHQRPILDFGCGWGRLIRLLYYFSDPALIYGCDPWDEAVQICRTDRVLGNLAVSDYLPRSLPFDRQQFDLVYAFSVFTHLSERAATAALKLLGEALSSNGVLAITIRPVEYWKIHPGIPARDLAMLEAEHATRGFAYRPHNREPVDGDITYGDTSISLDYLKNNFPQLQLRKIERSLDDPYQLVLFFTKGHT
ncbi:MAG: class I SAM-dependent methyltransferase, partial [Solirubrobacterales bacterium]